ncbi:MAG: adenylate/guanylate cyclase domain-containing protein [Bacteroidota bacterium]
MNKKSTDKRVIAANTGNIGLVYQDMSDFKHALQYYHEALQIFEELDIVQGKATAMGNIGNVYNQIPDYEKALEYFHKALHYNTILDNKSGMSIDMSNIGIVNISLNNLEKALEYLLKAEDIDITLQNPKGRVHTKGSIGIVYFDMGDFQNALSSFQEVVNIAEQLNMNKSVAIFTGNIGNVFAQKSFESYNPIKAQEYLSKAITLCQDSGLKNEEFRFHRLLSAILEQEGLFDKALHHFKTMYDIETNLEKQAVQESAQKLDFERKNTEREKQIAVERAKHEATEKLLHNVLPPPIAKRIISGETTIADKISKVSVLFVDIVDFTVLSSSISPDQLVNGLNLLFSFYDTIADKYQLEKIKTIGDAYMAVSGVPEQRDDHAIAIALMAKEILSSMKDFRIPGYDANINIRIGIHSGEVVAGVIGKKKYTYDLWGDAVNTASRMESHGEPSKIHVSETFKDEFLFQSEHTMNSYKPSDLKVTFHSRGEINVKGKGIMKSYFLE